MSEIVNKIKKVKDELFLKIEGNIPVDGNGAKARVKLYFIYRAMNAVMLWGSIALSLLLGSSTLLTIISKLTG